MAKMSSNNIPMNNMKKTEQKISHPRRFSTGNSIVKITEPTPIPIPNYLRASIGSCHDFCKYGPKHGLQPKLTRPPLSPKPKNNVVKNVSVEEKSSDKNHKGKKVLLPSTNKPEPSQTKNAEATRTFLKGSSNIRTRTNGGKDTNKSSLPKRALLPQSKTIKTRAVKPEAKKTNYENVPEKIIHVVEQKDEKAPSEDRKVDSNKSRTTTTTTRGGRANITPEETDSSPRKLKFRRGKVLEARNGSEGSVTEKGLRRVGSDREFVHKKNDSAKGSLRRQGIEWKNMNTTGLYNIVIEETASKLVKMRKSKVEALVGAFEKVIKIHDYESSRTSSNF
ncbi:hypothetical protein MIMGU_mgv1a009695mg [Erythranthe guttata]|uniref:Calmodulin-binding domain-containing protein n=1 Tax=Erythranthe guttata TaxID=4155 RepID=A0A022Q6D7_ERYGU|nr:hypothetical protein MIMGU_mgv1a009695mg [Erythranthe guttata]